MKSLSRSIFFLLQKSQHIPVNESMNIATCLIFVFTGSGIVTRRPLILQLIHVPRSAVDQARVEQQNQEEEENNDNFYDTEGL